MRIFGDIFELSRESIEKTCYKVYSKAVSRRPDRPVRDCLRVVLVTKPPFDYQQDEIIEEILDECPTIGLLTNYICEHG